MKKIKYIFLLIIGIVFMLMAYGAYRYYVPPRLREPYQMKKSDDTLHIAYIGDSWAYFHNEHDCTIPQILECLLHQPIKVHSYGICGLTSKEIYENMFNNADFRFFLQKQGYDYCFISAGINDTYKKMSISYYQHSMKGIIQFLLANDIHPIILEIPDYDIQKAYNWQKSLRKALRDVTMYINNVPVDCKQMYRDALQELINQKGYHNKISIIRYKSWNNNYQDDLQHLYLKDGMHLNSVGYAKLDSAIVDVITKTSNKKNNEHKDY